MASVRPWPEVPEAQWAFDYFDEMFENPTQSPEELRARASALRAEAAESDIAGQRNGCLLLAERYEAAADRLLAAR